MCIPVEHLRSNSAYICGLPFQNAIDRKAQEPGGFSEKSEELHINLLTVFAFKYFKPNGGNSIFKPGSGVWVQ